MPSLNWVPHFRNSEVFQQGMIPFPKSKYSLIARKLHFVMSKLLYF
jgi:hypothetical protein